MKPKRGRIATLSRLTDCISRPPVGRLAEPPPKMSGEKIPIDRELKLQRALTTLAPSAGIEYPLTNLADQNGWVQPGYIS
jgi:hypothetical protein